MHIDEKTKVELTDIFGTVSARRLVAASGAPKMRTWLVSVSWKSNFFAAT